MTSWVLLSAALSFAVTAAIGRILIPYLRRLHFGQTILDIGPRWHKNKEGTPTMGGLMFIAGILIAVSVSFAGASLTGALGAGQIAGPLNTQLISGLLMAVAFGLMGFADDFVKVVKKRNLGLTARQKLLIQFAIAAAYLWSVRLGGTAVTSVRIPFVAAPWQLGFWYYPLCAIGIVFLVNSVNLTDGIDGLAASVTLMASLGFLGIAAVLQFARVSLLAAAVAGGCLGFLVYNFHPARVFMGDTGSMFLGGCVVAMAFCANFPLVLALTGLVYIVESLSVVLQVSYFKATGGRRLFKMSPIHHHFEMSGWSEVKIVYVFSCVTIAASALAVLAARCI